MCRWVGELVGWSVGGFVCLWVGGCVGSWVGGFVGGLVRWWGFGQGKAKVWQGMALRGRVEAGQAKAGQGTSRGKGRGKGTRWTHPRHTDSEAEADANTLPATYCLPLSHAVLSAACLPAYKLNLVYHLLLPLATTDSCPYLACGLLVVLTLP